MSWPRILAAVVLFVCLALALGAQWIAPADYALQFRDDPDAAPSHSHLLGTDSLGRDRFSRLAYGARLSLILGPLAALASSALAVMVGGAAGFLGGWFEAVALSAMDLLLGVPWLFLLIFVRAVLPLNARPEASAIVTFALLAALGWAAAGRTVAERAHRLRRDEVTLQAHALGLSTFRTLLIHTVPRMAPVISAQFWIAIPVYILSEANLSILGLGVSEPLPSWGNMLRELEGLMVGPAQPWKMAGLLLLIATLSSFQLLISREVCDL